jgi:hypothetical protein
MLLAEDLLLLVTDDSTGRLVAGGTEVDVALGGARLVELALLERVDLADGRLRIRDDSPTGDDLLDDALVVVAGKAGKKPKDAVGPLGKKLRPRLYDRLVAAGVLRAEEGRILGIFPTKSWPAEQAAHEAELRNRIEHAVVRGGDADERTAALVSLLHALRSTHKVVDPKAHGLSKRDVSGRAKQIAEGDWGSAAVRRAIDDMMAAVMAATTAATVAATASTGG